jgi:hypothetical protein
MKTFVVLLLLLTIVAAVLYFILVQATAGATSFISRDDELCMDYDLYVKIWHLKLYVYLDRPLSNVVMMYNVVYIISV